MLFIALVSNVKELTPVACSTDSDCCVEQRHVICALISVINDHDAENHPPRYLSARAPRSAWRMHARAALLQERGAIAPGKRKSCESS
jgi:hypothetical protein